MTRLVTIKLVRACCSLAVLVALAPAGSAEAQTVLTLSETATLFSRPTEQSAALQTLRSGTSTRVSPSASERRNCCALPKNVSAPL